MANIYLDIIAGNDAKDGSSEANAVKTGARAEALGSAGDTIISKTGDDDAERWIAVAGGEWNNG